MKNDINVIVEPVYKIHPLKFKNINFKEYQALLVTSVNTIKILSEKVNIKQLKNLERRFGEKSWSKNLME